MHKSLHNSIYFIIFVFVSLLACSFGVFAEVSTTTFLGDIYENIKAKFNDPSLGNAMVTDIYKQSLKQVRGKSYMGLYEGLDTVVDTIKNSSQSYNCEVDNIDILTVLANIDNSLYGKLNRAIRDETQESVPLKGGEIGEACSEIMRCKQDTENTYSQAPHIACKMYIQELYNDIKYQNVLAPKIGEENQNSNLFQNGNSDDSDYDLLVDIQNIGKLMFEGFKPTIETLFYQMPEVSEDDFWDVLGDTANGDFTNVSDGTDGNVDWYFGPNNEGGFQCPIGIESATKSYGNINDVVNEENNNVLDETEGEGDNNTVIVLDEDEELQDFVSSVNTNISRTRYYDGVGTMGSDCINVETCGNGIIENNEQCDDGNAESGDGCSNNCLIEKCGDGIIQDTLGEQCDDGNDSNTDSCTNDCEEAKCGDGYILKGIEQCDDGNTESGDGCDSNCNIEWGDVSCGDGIVNGIEECDDGNLDNTDNCLSDCTLAKCGDGYLHTYVEQCDDGNAESGDGCSSICQKEADGVGYCGDGVLQEDLGEECDDGNLNSNNGNCKIDCTINVCGDGYINNNTEQCDDGNTDDNDCCSSSCMNEEVLSPEEVYQGKVTKLINAYNTIKTEEEGETSCIKECADLPLDDKFVCISQCACNEFSSKEMLGGTIKEKAFRIKFCMVQAQPITVTKGKRVYSIEEIFKEIKNVLQTLKDSGEMIKQVQTKEFLEISTKKNNFGKIFAPNIMITWKKPFNPTKADKKKKEFDNLENNLDRKSKGISKVKGTMNDRNKYVLFYDVVEDVLAKKDPKLLGDRKKMLDLELKANNFSNLDIEALARDNNTADVSREVQDFLAGNLYFWMDVSEYMFDIYDAAVLLKDKIVSAGG